MLVYIWSRRNPLIRMNFFGILNFYVSWIKNKWFHAMFCFIFQLQAPYLPWVLLGFSLLLGNAVYVDLMGIAVGHIYYFLEDVFPHQRGGFKLLKTPSLLLVISIPYTFIFKLCLLQEKFIGWNSRQWLCTSTRRTSRWFRLG